MRYAIGAALAASLILASNAVAGRLFGDIKVDGKPAPAGVLITIAPVAKPGGAGKNDAAPPDSTRTDKVGSYKVVVKAAGKCTLTVHHDAQKAALEVFSYKEATRYDLVLETKDDKLVVRRK